MKSALLILVLHSMLSAQTPSLADVARQERARQKNAGNAAPVTPVTNDTLGTAKAEPAAAPEKNASEKPAAKTDTTTKDEAWWRDAFKQARAEVKRSEDHLKVLQLELTDLNLALLTRSDIYNREMVIGAQINAKRADIAATTIELDANRQKLTQLEEDLRRSGAPTDWSR